MHYNFKTFLAIMFLALLPGFVSAQTVDYLVGQICDKAQLNSNYDAGNDWYGYQWYNRQLNIDASGHDINNLALDFDVYVENLDNPGNFSNLFDVKNKQGQTTFQFLELGNKQNNVDGLSDSNIKGMIKQAGWNHVTKKLTDFQNYARATKFDINSKLTWFRFCLAHVGTHDAYIIRLRNVNLVDLTGKKSGSDTGEKDYETNYNVADVPFSFDKSVDFTTVSDPQIINAQSFDPINVAKHDINKCYLQFDADITFTGGADFTQLGTNGQIELTSGGRSDLNEATFGIGSVDWKEGKHTYTIPLSSAGVTGGTIDWSAVNFMRLYWVHMPCRVGTIHFKLDNVKIVDYTTKTSLPTIFSDGMMFQQNKPMNIWGYAQAGKTIKVEFFKGNQSIGVQTATPQNPDAKTGNGKWEVTFPGQKASYDKYHFVVTEDGKELQTVNDILIGEVWLSGGQSNMALSVAVTVDAKDIQANANNDNIRFFMEPSKPTGETSPYEPMDDIAGGKWGYGTNANQINQVSAVAYSMVKNLQKRLNIPVGFINTAIGGSVIEAWLPREEIESDAALKDKLNRIGMYYDKDFWVDGATTITGFYNAKIGPLKGYNIAGTIWYQGESNSGRPELYGSEIKHLKHGWEKNFGFAEGTMPFIFTQVAPWPTNGNQPQFLAYLAEAMYDGWKGINDSKSGMLAIYDTDLRYDIAINNNADPIHPTNKTPIGKRFADAAYNLVYGSGEYMCAVPESETVKGDTIIVKFSHVGDGLKTKDGNKAVHGFAIAAADGAYANAEAQIISKDEVKVWSPAIANPSRVTYAWSTYSVASNLMNSANFPAAPFRSDRADGQTYYNPQDWTLCDSASVWAWDNGTTIYKKNVGWLDNWKTETAGAKISFPTDVKAEGRASLKGEYAAGGASFAPELRYNNRTTQLKNFKSLVVAVKNPDARKKTLSLVINGEEVGEAATIDASSDFTNVAFDISGLSKEAETIEFKVNDTDAGSVYLDNILFGTKDAKSISENPVTGINNIAVVDDAQNDSRIFNLAGQEVSKAYKGVVIANGKKLIQK